MTPTPPADGASEALRLRRELRSRLHAVDALTPPAAPDFAARAIAAANHPDEQPVSPVGQGAGPADVTGTAAADPTAPTATPTDEGIADPPTSDAGHPAPVLPMARRRRWPRVLVAAAAAVAIGAVAVPTLPRLMGGTASSGVAGSASAPQDRVVTPGAAPESAAGGPRAVTGSASLPVTPPRGSVDGAVPFASGVATGPSGSPNALTTAVERLRAKLTAAPYDALAVTLRVDPARVEIVLRAPDPAVLDLARTLRPGGTPVAVLATG